MAAKREKLLKASSTADARGKAGPYSGIDQAFLEPRRHGFPPLLRPENVTDGVGGHIFGAGGKRRGDPRLRKHRNRKSERGGMNSCGDNDDEDYHDARTSGDMSARALAGEDPRESNGGKTPTQLGTVAFGKAATETRGGDKNRGRSGDACANTGAALHGGSVGGSASREGGTGVGFPDGAGAEREGTRGGRFPPLPRTVLPRPTERKVSHGNRLLPAPRPSRYDHGYHHGGVGPPADRPFTLKKIGGEQRQQDRRPEPVGVQRDKEGRDASQSEHDTTVNYRSENGGDGNAAGLSRAWPDEEGEPGTDGGRSWCRPGDPGKQGSIGGGGEKRHDRSGASSGERAVADDDEGDDADGGGCGLVGGHLQVGDCDGVWISLLSFSDEGGRM